MKVTRKVEVDICDICGDPFNGEVHKIAVIKGVKIGDKEICSDCWSEPTEDMKNHIGDIVDGCGECCVNLREFRENFAVLYTTSCGDSCVAIAKDLNEAMEHSVYQTSQGSRLIDIFDHGNRTHANVVMNVIFGERTDVKDPRNICPQCGNEIDLEMCECGDSYADHSAMEQGHSFVPAGCCCGRDKELTKEVKSNIRRAGVNRLLEIIGAEPVPRHDVRFEAFLNALIEGNQALDAGPHDTREETCILEDMFVKMEKIFTERRTDEPSGSKGKTDGQDRG